MSDVTRLLEAASQGSGKAAEELIPLVYSELRRLAAGHLGGGKPGQTLQATALVHEAYLRLVRTTEDRWENRRHFFAAAVEAMRRILVESARRRKRVKHGGQLERVELDPAELAIEVPSDDILAVDEALERLAQTDAEAARVVKLRFFAGMTLEQAAEVMEVSPRTADNLWAFGRAWIRRFLREELAAR